MALLVDLDSCRSEGEQLKHRQIYLKNMVAHTPAYTQTYTYTHTYMHTHLCTMLGPYSVYSSL